MHGVPTLFDSQRELSQRTLTDFEVEGLKAPLSLADGHAYQDLSGVYSEILREFPSIWSWGIDTAIPDAEAYFLAAFAKLAKESSLQRQRHFRICPTASNSIDIVGAFLAARNLGVALVEPTFDNLALLLRRRKVPIFPVPESAIYEDLSKEARLRDFPNPTAIGALFLVNPNNPTGRELSNDQLAQLVDLCVDRGWVLILDNSFRFHSRKSLDDYGVLNASGIPYICIEDTGKTFSTLDMKASPLVYSESCAHIIEEIYGELFLCVSNFTLGLLGRLMELTERSDVGQHIRST